MLMLSKHTILKDTLHFPKTAVARVSGSFYSGYHWPSQQIGGVVEKYIAVGFNMDILKNDVVCWAR